MTLYEYIVIQYIFTNTDLFKVYLGSRFTRPHRLERRYVANLSRILDEILLGRVLM